MRRVRLILLTGPHVGEELEVESEVLLGRLPECDLRLDEHGVSRRHAQVRIEGDEVWVKDLQSSNGTKLRGRRVQEARLEDGDVLELGPAQVRIRIEAEVPPAAESRPVAPARPPAAPAAGSPPPATEARQRGGALQYHRIEDRRRWLLDDLSQAGPVVRVLVFVGLAGIGALVFWFVYTRL